MSDPAPKLQPVPPAAADVPPSARELRRARARRLAIRFALGVGVPTLVAIVYVLGIATPQYDSTAVFAVESHEERAATARGKDANAGNQRDARLLRAYVQSRAMLDLLAADHGLLDHYRRAGDVWARLGDGAGSERAYRYYRDKVLAGGERDGNVVHLRVRAFSPERARAFAEAIVAAAGRWIEDQSARARDELVAPAEAEVTRARDRLIAARGAAAAAAGAAAPDPGAAVADLRNDPIAVELALAEKQLDEAVAGLQSARLDAAAAARRLVVIAPPSAPTEPARPRPAWDIATVLVTSFVLVAVLSLLWSAVREHANF